MNKIHRTVSGAINPGYNCNFTSSGDSLTVAGSGSISTTGGLIDCRVSILSAPSSAIDG